MSIIPFQCRPGTIDGLQVVTLKQVSDGRGTIRELFRRSAFTDAGVDVISFAQINVTETRCGAVRGIHAENMTKLLSVVAGRALGVYVDGRPSSPTFGTVETIELVPGVQVLLPPGVGNGFQALAEPTFYGYCFDREWQPVMDGWACTPLDPALGIDWPIPIDPADTAQISVKDAAAPPFADAVGGPS